jgi:acylphosphatase
MKTAYRIVVQGRVQGVGYRWFTMQHAQRLNLNGYVLNLINGDVEVFAQGKDENLQEFISLLRKGPSFSQVTNLIIKDADFDNSFNYFKVKQ